MTIYVNPILRRKIEGSTDNTTLIQYALWFCSLLYLKAADKAEDDGDFGGYFPLQSSIVIKIVTTRFYGNMLRLLHDLGAVQIKGQTRQNPRGSYVPGALARKLGTRPASKQYRLVAAYRRHVERLDLPFDKLERRLDTRLMAASFTAMKGAARRWVIKSFESASFTGRAITLLDNHPFKTSDARHRAANHFAAIVTNRLRFSVCRKSGRVYYSVASLPKLLRAELLIDGEPTLELDISASQPTLLATLYPEGCEERQAYLAEVQSGSFYENLAAGSGKDWNRDRSKTEFFNQIAFGSYFCRDDYELLPAFTKRFPILASIMANIKKRGNDKLPILMQKLEATIAIDGACGECAQRGIKVLPVHDSLVVRESEAEAVREIFARHWVEKTGIPARIKGDRAPVGSLS
jgi:hypothetical protein